MQKMILEPSSAKTGIACLLLVMSIGVLVYFHETTPLVPAPFPLQQTDSSSSLQLRKDFASFFYASRAVRLGKNPYETSDLNLLAAGDGVRHYILPYLYPPFFAIVAQPLALLSPETAQRVWDYTQILGAGVVCVLVFLTLPLAQHVRGRPSVILASGGISAVVMALLPFRGNLDYGQMNILVVLFLSLTLYVYFRTKYDWLAGLALSLAVLLKVTPVIFIFFFLFNRRMKVLVGFLSGVVFFLLSSIVMAGTEPWVQFLSFLPSMGYAGIVDGGLLPSVSSNFSIAGFIMRVFVGELQTARLLTMCVAAALLGILLYCHTRRTGDGNEGRFVLPYSILMVIASPMAWMLHLVYLFPGIVFTLLSQLSIREDQRGEVHGAKQSVLLPITAIIMALSVYDFPSLYPSLAISENLRPFVTSMNLFFLVVLFFTSLALREKQYRQSSP